MEARDNQDIGGKEPGWALGLEDNLRNCVVSRGQSIWLWRSLSCSGGGGDIQNTLEFEALACRHFSF